MLTIIVPTYNEAGALPLLVDRVKAAMEQVALEFELVIVDDNSPDGTGRLAEQLALTCPIQVIHRPGKNGLASAVLDGLQVARGDLIAVIDADLSHPPETIPAMVQALSARDVDLAVGSRYVPGGGIEDWPARRKLVSAVANGLTHWLTPVKDATSGFFVIRRSALDGVDLNPIGFKIGLEVMARARYRKYVEIPYVFTDRKHGSSKFGLREILAFLKQLWILYLDRRRARHGPSHNLPAANSPTQRPD